MVSVSRLVGAPPGYVGYDEGGMLTEKVRRKPYSVILLDEIEKAHPDVFNILLQVLEDGNLTDSFGRTVDFRNAVLIMTSNLGGDLFDGEAGLDETGQAAVTALLRHHFRPEFLNRVDDQILFQRLDRESLRRIVGVQFNDISNRLQDRGLTATLSDAARARLAEAGYDPVYGARPLRRYLQHELETRIGRAMIAGDVRDGATIRIDAADDELTVTIEAPQPEVVAV